MHVRIHLDCIIYTCTYEVREEVEVWSDAKLYDPSCKQTTKTFDILNINDVATYSTCNRYSFVSKWIQVDTKLEDT